MHAPVIWVALASFLALAMTMGAWAADGAKRGSWTLATDDTELSLSVADSAIGITGLRNPRQKWNWTPAASPVPMPGIVAAKDAPPLRWEFAGAEEDKSNGHQVTLRFTSAKPALEMKSIWRAEKGPGPVENWVVVENKSGADVVFAAAPPAAAVAMVADAAVTLHRADKTQAGRGKVHIDVVGPKVTLATNIGQIPFIMLGVGAEHGAYLGYEWEVGGFRVMTDGDALKLSVSAHPVTENVTRAVGATFLVPSVYYGAYVGDFDDGSNRFKRWFWKHKITRSLYENKDEPWVEVCMQEIGGKGSTSITGKTPQSTYDRLAATGVECVKMDFWDGTGKCWYNDKTMDWQYKPEVWPDGFDFARKAHKAGVKASLYMGGTYMNVDLNTIAGRDQQLAALLKRYDEGWFDMWRTDRYTAPRNPFPDTYEGVTNFLYIQDHLIKNRPGYRYENCCNGGRYKGFAICRRMTFCTMNDDDKNAWPTRSTYYANSFAICPVQLKSDLGPTHNAYFMRTNMLGSILTWASDAPIYREHIALYKKKQRPILRGANVYRILPMADGTNWDGLMYYNPDLEQGSVFLFKPSAKAADGDSKVIKLKGLERKATYALTFQDRLNLNARMTGAQLMDEGIAVSGMTGDQASEIIWIEKAAR